MFPSDIPAALQAYARIVHSVATLKRVAAARNSGWKAGGSAGTNSDQLSVLLEEMKRFRDTIIDNAQEPGVQAVFRSATGDAAFSLAQEIADLTSLGQAAAQALLAAIPRSPQGAMLFFEVDSDGVRVHTHPDQGDLDVVTAAVDDLIAGIG